MNKLRNINLAYMVPFTTQKPAIEEGGRGRLKGDGSKRNINQYFDF